METTPEMYRVNLRLRAIKAGGGFNPWVVPGGRGHVHFVVDTATDRTIHDVDDRIMMRLTCPFREALLCFTDKATRGVGKTMLRSQRRYVVKLERRRDGFQDAKVPGIGVLSFVVKPTIRQRLAKDGEIDASEVAASHNPAGCGDPSLDTRYVPGKEPFPGFILPHCRQNGTAVKFPWLLKRRPDSTHPTKILSQRSVPLVRSACLSRPVAPFLRKGDCCRTVGAP